MNKEEAIKIVRSHYPANKQMLNEALEFLIPELKEDESEKIRKEIIAVFKGQIAFTSEEDAKKYIDWLEKQGNIDSQVKLSTFTFDDVLALQCCMETVKKVQEDNELYEQLQSLHDRLHDAYWLEKQGEQKYIPKYKIGDYIKNTNYKGEPIYEIIYMDKECYICKYRGKERMGDKAVMHFSFDNPYLRLVQKPAGILFQKMKESGYTWDSKKKELKELKKIEQK